MKYLKVFTDFVENISELGDAERGRLFTAMLEYASTGIEPELNGNERYLWGTAKKNIDNQRGSYETRCAVNAKNGSLGGKQKQANASESKRNVAKSSDSLQEKDKDKDLKEKPTNVGKKKSGFQPPTPAEVQAYCDERKNGISGQAFVDWYGARKWMLSKGVQMSDWRSAVRVWEQRDREAGVRRVKFNRAAHGYEQVGISDTAVDRMTVRLDGG